MAREFNEKFSKKDIEKLRKEVTGDNAHDFAQEYHVSWHTIRDAVNGKHYQHYNEEFPPQKLSRKISITSIGKQARNEDICLRLKNCDNKKERALEVKSLQEEYGISESAVSLIASGKR